MTLIAPSLNQKPLLLLHEYEPKLYSSPIKDEKSLGSYSYTSLVPWEVKQAFSPRREQ